MAEQRNVDRAVTEGELYRLLVTNVVDYAIFVVDDEGLVRTWSQGAERLLGYREDEIVGRSADVFYTPEDIRDGVLRRERQEALEIGRGDDDRWHVRKDGTRFWSGGVMTPLRDEVGTLRGFAKIMRDRTEWWHAEQARREAESRFRQMADTMPQIVWVTRPDGHHEYYNRRWYEYIGCAPEQCIGHGWSAPLHPDDRRRAVDLWDHALRTGEPYEIEYRFRSKEGEYRWFLGRALPVRDDAGRIVKWFGTCTDIEDMKRSEEEARLSHARFEAVLDAAPIGVYVVDAALRIRQVNPKARPVFGDIEGLIGGDFEEVIHVLWPPAYAAEVVGRFRHTLETGEPCIVPERIEERLDRRVLEYYDWQVHRILLPGGRSGVVCYFSDISRHVLARQALAEADRRKDVFLATLAHELRNPLAPIRTGLEILKHKEGDNPAVEPLRAMMDRQAEHLATLIDDLMDLSRISLGKIGLRKGVVELGSVIDQAVATARPLIEERGHELIVNLPDGGLRLEADRTRLEQVLANLLENAAKYTDPGGHVRVSARREGGEVVIGVEDTGIGIDPEKLTTVFEMFVQVERRLDRSQGGLGIGLSLVRSLVEMHGGTVTAHSEGPGTGTQFVVRLPAMTEDRGERHGPTKRPKKDGGHESSGRRILVVDDNQDAADSLARYLSRVAGHRVEVAYDGPEALDLARRFRPDVVLLDIGLPGMSG